MKFVILLATILGLGMCALAYYLMQQYPIIAECDVGLFKILLVNIIISPMIIVIVVAIIMFKIMGG